MGKKVLAATVVVILIAVGLWAADIWSNPAPSQPAAAQGSETVKLAIGEMTNVAAFWTCSGDIEVNGEKLYDSNADTALIVYLESPASVYAQWGATCVKGDHRDEMREQIVAKGRIPDVQVWRLSASPTDTAPSLGATITPTATVTATATVTPTAVLVRLPPPYESEGGLPTSETSWTFDVAPHEVEVLTAGPASIAGVNLPGGENRGSVILLLPDPTGAKVVRYTVTNLLPGSNWHGAYDLGHPPSDAEVAALVQDRVRAMQGWPNCTDGNGCATVDVLVVGSGPRVIMQTTVP